MELADLLAVREWVVRLVASDLSRDALEQARRGCYSRFEVGRGLSPERLHRWFDRTGEGWIARPELRRAVEF